ncbi:MAG: 4-hydroxy-tetrahydrodipicolinate synthase [Rhodospirillaceae bacterium]|nr:MAG: 4-hydroxy-tetrahydrodipicolinate synthase [Rhodospirillaceae bacterium]
MILLPDQSFRGAYTPLLTPFRDGRVDYGAFAAFVDWQIKQGADGLVVGGTTAEPMSLTVTERKDLLRVAMDVTRLRVPVIAATGAASVADTLALTEHASAVGAAASLVLTPIYAKPTDHGLVNYFLKVAAVTTRPFMLYQIPSRTCSAATIDVCRAVADVAPHFIGMKQSADDRGFVGEVVEALGPDFRVFMGLSDIAWDMIGHGASGLIVALSNVAPGAVTRIFDLAVAGEEADANAAYNEIAPLNALVVAEPNPIPVKYMAWRMGLIPTLEYRLPLEPPSDDLVQRIDQAMAGVNLI